MVSLYKTSGIISWLPLPDNDVTAITRMQISFRLSRNVDHATFLDLDPRSSSVQLQDLTSGSAYVSYFLVQLINGTSITSPPLHFVTVEDGKHRWEWPLSHLYFHFAFAPVIDATRR
jgi:hypothetical protein